MADNLLFYGDNLDVLRRHIKDETVDLVYLDPPFNSNANYNVLFAARDGEQAAAQIQAFEDTWHWDSSAAASFQEVVQPYAWGGPYRNAFRNQAHTQVCAYRRRQSVHGRVFLFYQPEVEHPDFHRLPGGAAAEPVNFPDLDLAPRSPLFFKMEPQVSPGLPASQHRERRAFVYRVTG